MLSKQGLLVFKRKIIKFMKKLELLDFGVVEMGAKEMKEIGGGKCPGINWLMQYNEIMLIEDDYERESVLAIWMGLWTSTSQN